MTPIEQPAVSEQSATKQAPAFEERNALRIMLLRGDKAGPTHPDRTRRLRATAHRARDLRDGD
jgi:hypothetical protein